MSKELYIHTIRQFRDECEKKHMDTEVEALDAAISALEQEIIRCKDCKHFAGEGMYCANDIIVQFDHFYCYDAERRKDG